MSFTDWFMVLVFLAGAAFLLRGLTHAFRDTAKGENTDEAFETDLVRGGRGADGVRDRDRVA